MTNYSAPAPPNAYDETPYPGLTYSYTHPERMAVIALLRGLSPPPLESCRVLEIGCASGYNLIPMAMGLPDCEFVGIDYSARQIASGQAVIRELGVENVQLRHADVSELDDSLGQFDYVIAHGFYSWVPAPVRTALLALLQQALTPDGLAYVSYNAYPGWHFLEAARKMMLYRVRHIHDPQEKAATARQFIQFLADSSAGDPPAYSAFYDAYRAFLEEYVGETLKRDTDDGHFLHDELEEDNQPFYFHEFVEDLAGHSLQYVGDVDFSTMMATNLPGEISQELRQIARDEIEAEQHLDFLRNRLFRKSVICRGDRNLGGGLDLAVIERFRFSSLNVAQEIATDSGERQRVRFVAPNQSSLTTDHPVSIAALDHLGAVSPRNLTLDELLKAAVRQLARADRAKYGHLTSGNPQQRRAVLQRERKILAANLLKAYASSSALVELHLLSNRAVATPSERPVASAWARFQAKEATEVTNLELKRVQLDPLMRFLFVRLDGTRTAEELAQEVLDGPVAEGFWSLEFDGETDAKQPGDVAAAVAKTVRRRLAWMARSGLLSE